MTETGTTIDPDLLARRAKIERAAANSPEGQALMEPIFTAMRSCYDHLDPPEWDEDEHRPDEFDLIAVIDFASDTFSMKLGGADWPGGGDPRGQMRRDRFVTAMRAYANFARRQGLIWDPARQALVVTIEYWDFGTTDISIRGGALDLFYAPGPGILE